MLRAVELANGKMIINIKKISWRSVTVCLKLLSIIPLEAPRKILTHSYDGSQYLLCSDWLWTGLQGPVPVTGSLRNVVQVSFVIHPAP
jgi:hypothetical protein